jgi:hypothetical protein
MKRGWQRATRDVAVFLWATVGMHAGLGAQVPAELPDPDGAPGNPTKPVQVYILAGQSNMVGMGDISGAQNVYSGVFLSSDPAIPEGPLPVYRVGNHKVSRLRVMDPSGAPTDAPIAVGLFEVDERGTYRVRCGFGASARCAMEVRGVEVYRYTDDGPAGDEVLLTPGTRYEFEISGFEGSPPRFWLEKTDLLGNGDLEAVARREGKFPWLVDDAGEWTVRQDVYFQEARLAEGGKGSPLSATSNGKSIGPELGFGHVVGTFHDEQVLLIKTAQGNRSLGFDFRPPSSGRTAPDNEFESAEWRLMVKGVRDTLARIDAIVPGYAGQGYEIAGFAWFQGHKDSGSEESIDEYEQHLVHLIQDVRAEFGVPNLPTVIATVGFGGDRMADKFRRILDAQMAVGDPDAHPEFAGSVTSIDTRPFWREVDESPKNQDYHYNRNAETYLLVGDALGRAMVRLRGAAAEDLDVPPRPRRPAAELAPEARTTDTARSALQPILLDGIAAQYAANPRFRNALEAEASGQRPGRPNQFLQGATFGLVQCYREAGVTDYDWHDFGPDLDGVDWHYTSFDPVEVLAHDKGNRFRPVTLPNGAADWLAPGFDAVAAGWKVGRQPFGQLDGRLDPLTPNCVGNDCRCGETPRSLWEREVLLVRGTLELPPLRAGHRYRVVVGGSAHVNAGEGFALWADGLQLMESNTGVGRGQGGQPRGAYVYSDVRGAFEDGTVTLAAMSFLRFHHPRQGVIPPRGHLTLRLQEQKLPPLR